MILIRRPNDMRGVRVPSSDEFTPAWIYIGRTGTRPRLDKWNTNFRHYKTHDFKLRDNIVDAKLAFIEDLRNLQRHLRFLLRTYKKFHKQNASHLFT